MMNAQAEATHLLHTLSQELGITPPLEFNPEGECLLVLDGMGFVLALENDVLTLTGLIGRLYADAASDAFCRKALAANFYWGRTGGGTLALDTANNFACMHLPITLPRPQPDNFIDIVRNFVGSVAHWQQELDAVEEPAIAHASTGLRV